MHVRFHGGGIEAQRRAFCAALSVGKARQNFVKLDSGFGLDAIGQLVEHRKIKQRVVIHAHEKTQPPPVANTGHQIAKREVLNLRHDDQPPHALGRDALAVALEFFLARFEKFSR